MDEVEDPEDVGAAREQLEALQREKETADRVRLDLQKQLMNAKDRASKIEEVGLWDVVKGAQKNETMG